jgi:serine phosphatase RsbU (regulator of sigma subunit)
MNDIAHHAHRLAGARATLQTAAASAAKVRAEADALEARLADALAKHADALADLRAGALTEAVGGARMAAAHADAQDLRGLLAAVQPRLEEAGQVRDRAEQAVADAERAFARAEQEATMAELDARIRHIEATLCSAIAARFRLGCEHENSPYAHTLARHWRPSEPLRRAIVEFTVPGTSGTHDTVTSAATSTG